jgi:roadblock/LC7 domain-containing protein
MGTATVEALKPGGKLILVEYRGEDPSVPIKPLHKMTEAQAIKEMRAIGLTHLRTERFLPQQHFLVFEKPAADPAR